MAVGFSGSNGGISRKCVKISPELFASIKEKMLQNNSLLPNTENFLSGKKSGKTDNNQK